MGTILKHCYVFMSHDFQSVYCNWVQRKSPLILKVVVDLQDAYASKVEFLSQHGKASLLCNSGNCICCNNFNLKNKNVNCRKLLWSFQDEWKA